MNIIEVKASKTYQVLVGSGLLNKLGTQLKNIVSPCKAVIISDSNVFPHYGMTVTNALEREGYTVSSYIFPAGEAQKNTETYCNILNFLAQNQITRSDVLIALGGGVVGDMTGFAAATFLRGIAYVQVPTSLLAMVDSSVGGKTAIDLPVGKNLVGAFYQPSLVLCDIATLQTLPQQIFSDGCAEVIKYGMLYDPNLFDHLEKYGLSFDREYVINRCIELKRDVVCTDEFDRGERAKLNFGHTIGHSIEANSNYAVTHGQAVAIGMAMMCKAGGVLGFCLVNVYQRLCNTLEKFGLPYATDYSVNELYETAMLDKKRCGNIIHLVMPKNIGDSSIFPATMENFKMIIKAGK